MTTNQAKKQLQQLGQLRREIDHISQLRQTQIERATRTTATLDCQPKAKGYTADRVGDHVAQAQDLDEILAGRLEKWLDAYICAYSRIRQIPNPDQQDVLVYRYICGLDWPQIAKNMAYSDGHALRLHRQALEQYAKLSMEA